MELWGAGCGWDLEAHPAGFCGSMGIIMHFVPSSSNGDGTWCLVPVPPDSEVLPGHWLPRRVFIQRLQLLGPPSLTFLAQGPGTG